MTHSDARLETHLNDWRECRFRNAPPEALAERILGSAEKILSGEEREILPRSLWHDYLNITGESAYLRSLPDDRRRRAWAETAFQAIRQSNYSIKDMFDARVEANGDRILFQDMSFSSRTDWSYRQISRITREIAAAFTIAADGAPRVAIVADNSLEGACCDLACLFYDIPDAPLSPHFDQETLTDILDRLGVNIVVTDTEDQARRLAEVQKKVRVPFLIFGLNQPTADAAPGGEFLDEYRRRLNPHESEALLKKRARFDPDQVATVMFTSGSTGTPKGVSFSQYNLVSKRFARAAALPGVGENEVLLCYLPLYHTFGRYLEMLGSIYWGGTYVFTGNPSAETLFSLFPKVNPTGFISIPLRWAQLQERCVEAMAPIPEAGNREKVLRDVIGTRLRWGLSAAGYLSPSVFHFFERYGVQLCSGFGMTEATGGITMTPPGRYRDESVGLPLPGIHIELSDVGEMRISGPYIGAYLEDKPPGARLPSTGDEEDNLVLATGDVFEVLSDGYYRIVDRIKDIYKNNKGQTIAPRRVEEKFEGVPGIKRTFLVGDARADNVLLIIPQKNEPIFDIPSEAENQREYFHRIVTAANSTLAPFERVINYTLLERDFELEREELTPKGSYNRKTIEKNFSTQIEKLYRGSHVSLSRGPLSVKIPRWFFRDLGILEDDIEFSPYGLINRRSGTTLAVRTSRESSLLIGDLEYSLSGKEIDMGLFARQPRLWIGNPALIAFCPCREGWDLPLGSVSAQVFLPWKNGPGTATVDPQPLSRIRDHNLAAINRMICHALFSPPVTARECIESLGRGMSSRRDNISEVIHRRLEALARHPDEGIRCQAYRLLLMDEPDKDYSKAFPAFVHSGLPFINEDSIEALGTAELEIRRLEALRRRLLSYRNRLDWPGSAGTRVQFQRIFQMLHNFVPSHPEYFNSVRAELASWILFDSAPELAKIALEYFQRLSRDYEESMEKQTPDLPIEAWEERLVFDQSLTDAEIIRIKGILIGTTFLKQSILLIHDEKDFDLLLAKPKGIWVSRILSPPPDSRYRVCVNMKSGKHYDLQLIVQDRSTPPSLQNTLYWYLAVGGYPFIPRVLPRTGCGRADLGALSVASVSGLSAWNRIQDFSGAQAGSRPDTKPNSWRKLFIESMAAFFRGWRNSGFRILPGEVSPGNVFIPEADYFTGATIFSITGYKLYRDTLSLVTPMIQNFYLKTVAHYPWSGPQLDLSWVFDACHEALGGADAEKFLKTLREDLRRSPLSGPDGVDLAACLDRYTEERCGLYYLPLPVYNAVDRYDEWKRLNPSATSAAKEETVNEVHSLYRLDRYPEIARYYLFHKTYFLDMGGGIDAAFERLLSAMRKYPGKPAIQRVELSDLQAALHRNVDRNVFARMVFPRFPSPQQLQLMKISESEQEKVVLQTVISDRHGEDYSLRPPLAPAEIGQLYRAFYLEKYPITIHEQDRHHLAIDGMGRVIGGISYTLLENNVAHIDGIVVSSSLKRRGIGGAMLEDFCGRMRTRGVSVIKTHFFIRRFYQRHGFQVDKRWGALVRFLSDPPD